jgi:hypothetical protein
MFFQQNIDGNMKFKWIYMSPDNEMDEKQLNSSKFIKIHQNSSNFIKFHQISSDFIRFHQISSNFIKFHQISSNFIKFHQISSNFIKFHQISSKFIKIHQSSSKFIKIHQNSPKCAESIWTKYGTYCLSSHSRGLCQFNLKVPCSTTSAMEGDILRKRTLKLFGLSFSN